jgi:putative spermidine/putrescine transport system substrate-binding protein
MSAAVLAAGGAAHDLQPGKKVLLELRKPGVRICPASEAFAAGLKSKEGTFPST